METGFELINIVLLESHFKREATINFNNLQTNASFEIGQHNNDNTLSITFGILVEQKNKDTNSVEVEVKVQMIGVFRFTKDTSLSVDDFARVNAPAIIFPFVREHIANLSMRAGIPLIILQPLNFTKLPQH